MNPVLSLKASLIPIGGGAYVLDKAGGIAKASFSKKTTADGFNLFDVTVNNCSILFPSFPNPVNTSLVQWFGATLFIFEIVQTTFLKIEKEDVKGNTNTSYVDLNRTGLSYFVFKCLPQEITKEEALRKIEGVICKPACLLVNSHGTALLAHKDDDYDVYFAHPDEARVKKIDYLSSFIDKKSKEFQFQSKDNFIELEKNWHGKTTINKKPAILIDL